MGLRAKFNWVLFGVFAIGLFSAAVLSYYLSQDTARRQVLQEATILMASASATSDFTEHEIAPLLADKMTERFLPQTVPFWVAQADFRQVTMKFPDYSVREPALNPTNIADRPAPWETDIINIFRADPTLREYVSTRPTQDGEILSLSRPIRVEPDCLRCHSTATAAPVSMVALYGPDNGFGWKNGEVVGAQIVSVPVQVAQERAMRGFLVLLGGLAAVFALVILLLNAMLNVTVVKPVRRLATIADQVSTGSLDQPEYTPPGNDEIASLATSFNRMRRSVESALNMLDRS